MFDKKDQGRWWDFGWQLIEGCTKISPACKNCWSLEKEKRFGIPKEVVFHPERLDRPLKRKKSTSYAIWNDLFHEDVSFKQIDDVIGIISQCPQHIFIILTKRPKRALEFFKWMGNQIKKLGFDSIPSQSNNPFDYYSALENVWIGVTAENQKTANERIPILLDIPAAKRFVSIEPMLGSVDLTQIYLQPKKECVTHNVLSGIPYDWDYEQEFPENRIDSLDWVIVGGESGHNTRPMHPDWARSIRDQCKEANTPFFFKQWGEWIKVGECGNNEHSKYYNAKNCTRLNIDGGMGYHGEKAYYMKKVGTKNSGSKLDGQHHKEFPI